MIRALLAVACVLCSGLLDAQGHQPIVGSSPPTVRPSPSAPQKPPAGLDRLDEVLAALPASERPTARMVLVRGSSTGRRIVRAGLSAAGKIPPVKGKPAVGWKEADLLAKLKRNLVATGWKTFSGFLKAQPKAEHAVLVKMLGIRIDLPRRT